MILFILRTVSFIHLHFTREETVLNTTFKKNKIIDWYFATGFEKKKLCLKLF